MNYFFCCLNFIETTHGPKTEMIKFTNKYFLSNVKKKYSDPSDEKKEGWREVKGCSGEEEEEEEEMFL